MLPVDGWSLLNTTSERGNRGPANQYHRLTTLSPLNLLFSLEHFEVVNRIQLSRKQPNKAETLMRHTFVDAINPWCGIIAARSN